MTDRHPLLRAWLGDEVVEQVERNEAAGRPAHATDEMNTWTVINDLTIPDTADAWVYWLLRDDVPVYIGKTTQPRQRLIVHCNQGRYFDDVVFYPCGSLDAADRLERRMIDTHNPQLNRQHWPTRELGR